MNILIVGKSASGKSNLGDLLKSYLFRRDKDCSIHVDDKDRQIKSLGSGPNIYNIYVRQLPEKEVMEKADIVIDIKNQKFLEVFQNLSV